jgi:hypothetical protein
MECSVLQISLRHMLSNTFWRNTGRFRICSWALKKSHGQFHWSLRPNNWVKVCTFFKVEIMKFFCLTDCLFRILFRRWDGLAWDYISWSIGEGTITLLDKWVVPVCSFGIAVPRRWRANIRIGWGLNFPTSLDWAGFYLQDLEQNQITPPLR